MCAIKPVNKKRIIFDFYTSNPESKTEAFNQFILDWCLVKEQEMNRHGFIRLHVKETEQEAE